MRRAGKTRGAKRHGFDRASPPPSFAEMFDMHGDDLYRYVFRRCRDHSVAEDIVQETFLAALRATDGPSSINKGWLYTVARNRLLDVLRRQSRYQDKLRLLGAGQPDQVDQVSVADRLRVEQALGEVSVDYRLVLTLHYLDGLTVREIAEHLGRSAKSVEGLVTRARRELRTRLDEDLSTGISGGGNG